jgi:hypothetical protein
MKILLSREEPCRLMIMIPLGYKTTIVGEFKIAIDEADGFLVNKKIFLEDKLLGKTKT